jgi:hypothetical protein
VLGFDVLIRARPVSLGFLVDDAAAFTDREIDALSINEDVDFDSVCTLDDCDGCDERSFDEPLDPWLPAISSLGIQNFRPLQARSLEIIELAFHTSQAEQKLATVGIVCPTSSGKDLLPLAWAVFRRQVSVMFVPFKHLYDKAYAAKFHCTSEVFQVGVEDTAANLLICAYEHSEWVS